MNSVSLIGNLVRDPELKSIGEGTDLCKLSVAVNEGFGDKAKVYFFDVQCWNATAKNVAKYTSKGSKVAISGSLRQETWEKDDKKFSKTVVNAFNVEFLSKSGEKAEAQDSAKSAEASADEDDGGDLPF